MSSAKCESCRGLLPPWLEAAKDPQGARCPNCGHMNKLGTPGPPSATTTLIGTGGVPAMPPASAPAPRPKQTSVPIARTQLLAALHPVQRPAAAIGKMSPSADGKARVPLRLAAKTELRTSPTPRAPRPAAAAAAPEAVVATPAPAVQPERAPAAGRSAERKPTPSPDPAPVVAPGPAPAFAPAMVAPAARAPAFAPAMVAPVAPAPEPASRTAAVAPPPAAPPPPSPSAKLAVVTASNPVGDFSIEIESSPAPDAALPAWATSDETDVIIEEEAALTSPSRRARLAKISAAAVALAGGVVFATVAFPHRRNGAAPEDRTDRPPPAVTKSDPPAPKNPPPAKAPPAAKTAPAAESPPPAKNPPAAETSPVARPPRSEPVAPPSKIAEPKPAPEHAEPTLPRPAPVHEHAERTLAAAEPAHTRPSASAPSEEDRQRAHAAYARGNEKLFQGAIDEAIAAFKESLRLDPRDPAAQRGLGLAYVQAGNAGQAVHYLKRYLKAAPTAPDRQLIEKRIEQLSNL